MSHPTSAPLEVRVLPLDLLRPAPYNPRTRLAPESPAYRKLAASLREFGLVEPLVWNETTGFLVGGHARLEILRDLGVSAVPVSVVRLDPAREKALNVILNNQEAQGRYDPGRLADLLAELQGLEQLELTGFDPGDLAALRFTPPPELTEQADVRQVEVTLVTDPDTYARLSPRLDALVGEFDLTSHVRYRRERRPPAGT